MTAKPDYKIVIETVSRIRDRLLADPLLRQPILHIFNTVYQDDSKLPEHLKNAIPVADQIRNMMTTQQIRTEQPCDGDVIDFLTNGFPDLYLKLGGFPQGKVPWGETSPGRESAEEEAISMNICLVQLWLEAVSAQNSMMRTRGLNLYYRYLYKLTFLGWNCLSYSRHYFCTSWHTARWFGIAKGPATV